VSDNSERSPRPSGASVTHVPSIISEMPSASAETLGDHHRWKFALPRSRPKLKRRRSTESLSSQNEKGSPMREKHPHLVSSRPSRPRWPTSRKRLTSEILPSAENETSISSVSRSSRSDTLRLDLSFPPPRIPFTLSQNKTPGWESPWTPRIPDRALVNERDPELEAAQHANDAGVAKEPSALHLDGLRPWQRRKKRLRNFLLHNAYVPLVSLISIAVCSH
jgi:hypothetical protein